MARAKTTNLNAILAIIAGIIILLWPNILGIAVGLFLIISGILNLLNK